jgi:hypothetical protein
MSATHEAARVAAVAALTLAVSIGVASPPAQAAPDPSNDDLLAGHLRWVRLVAAVRPPRCATTDQGSVEFVSARPSSDFSKNRLNNSRASSLSTHVYEFHPSMRN